MADELVAPATNKLAESFGDERRELDVSGQGE
jgi:hypothetical protein